MEAIDDVGADDDIAVTVMPSAPSRWAAFVGPSRGTLMLHAAALLVVLLALLPLADNGHIAAPDEGLYLAQASNLADGSWSSERPAVDVDPDGLFTPATDGGVVGERNIPYTKHALFPILLMPTFALGGTTGALALSALGTWGAALAAAFLARRVNLAHGQWVLWLVGVGSPLIFDAYIAVAHSIAAAFAGLAFLGLTRTLDDRRPVHLTYALPAVALVVALRGEGVVFAAALGGVIGLMALGWPPLRRVDWRAAWIGAAVLAVGATTYVLNGIAARAILGSSVGVTSPLDRLTSSQFGPLDGAWASLLRPFGGTWANAGVLLPLAALGVILAAVAIRIVPTRTLLPLALLLGAAGASIGLWITPPGLVTGLFAAFPVLLAGLISIGRDDLRSTVIVRSLGASGLFAAIVILGNYSSGGAAEWGGRFFHLLIPILVPIVVVGLDRARQRFGRREQLVALACIAIVTLSLSGAAVRSLTNTRRLIAELVTESVQHAVAHDQPLIVMTTLAADGTSRAFWDVDDPEVLTANGLTNLHLVLNGARAVGREQVLVVVNMDGGLFEAAFADQLEAIGWEVVDVDGTTPTGVASLIILERTDN